jgi:predicted DNA-binding transcriptional regulator AlpA
LAQGLGSMTSGSPDDCIDADERAREAIERAGGLISRRLLARRLPQPCELPTRPRCWTSAGTQGWLERHGVTPPSDERTRAEQEHADRTAQGAIEAAGGLVTRPQINEELGLSTVRGLGFANVGAHPFPAPVARLPGSSVWTRAAIEAWVRTDSSRPASNDDAFR